MTTVHETCAETKPLDQQVQVKRVVLQSFYSSHRRTLPRKHTNSSRLTFNMVWNMWNSNAGAQVKLTNATFLIIIVIITIYDTCPETKPLDQQMQANRLVLQEFDSGHRKTLQQKHTVSSRLTLDMAWDT